jgi:hypothetical protein
LAIAASGRRFPRPYEVGRGHRAPACASARGRQHAASAVVFAHPGPAIALLFGCYLIIAGFCDVLAGLSAESADTSRCVFAVLLRVLALIAGLIVLVRPAPGCSPLSGSSASV